MNSTVDKLTFISSWASDIRLGRVVSAYNISLPALLL